MSDDLEGDETEEGDDALGAARSHVKADVDLGGGVILANRPGGYYMGRLLVGQSFDRHGGWYFSDENQSNYAWAMAWGHSNACLWVGPSRGKAGFTAGDWATPSATGEAKRCTEAQKQWLGEDDGAHIASHFNCPPPSNAAHGTEKALLHDSNFYWNVSWTGGASELDGGALKDLFGTIPAGTHVWYRYTTRDGNRIVAFIPGVGWGFFPIGALDRSHTGSWSFPTDPAHPHGC